MAVGEEYLAYIVSDSINTDGEDYTEITYSVAEGSSLPAGLTLDSASGEISGTPTEGGEFTVDFVIKASKSSGGQGGGPGGSGGGTGGPPSGPGGSTGGPGGSSDDEYTFTYTFSIAGGTDTPGEPVEEGGVMMRVQDGYIQYSSDGGKTWTNVVSLDDIKGDKGDPGDPGEPAPEDPGDEGGCGGNIAGTVSIVGVCLLLGLGVVAFIKRRKSDD